MNSLAGKTIIMSGGSRGVGLAVALRAAADGANVTLIAKTDMPHPKLPGTVHTAAAEIEQAGGKALPVVGDIRKDDVVAAAVAATVERFGGIDIVVNNASALNMSSIGELSASRYDLMMDINARGTFLLTSLALPHLLQAANPHVLTMSPPLNMDRRWLGAHAPYTLSKYAMTILTLGVAEHNRDQGIAANCLWPRTIIATAAVQTFMGAEAMGRARTPQIVADAAHEVLTKPSREYTGQTLIVEDVLNEAGVFDFSRYQQPGVTEEQLEADFFM
jgi:citronellol/citronellal dehydrogenase